MIVTTLGGGSAATSGDQFTYIPAPAVTSLTPSAGPTGGGTSVTITGTDFSGATGVSFGGSAATTFTVHSATQVTATSPAGSGAVDVIVTTLGGSSAATSGDQFIYAAGPVVTSVFRNLGPTTGGTAVTISGANFTTATLVTFGTEPASSFVVESDASITAVSTLHAAGVVDLTVTTPGGTSPVAVADRFTFVGAKWCATFDHAIVPTSWVSHIPQTVTITVTNCGLNTWPASGTTRVDLYMHFTTVPGGSFKRSYWLNSVMVHIAKSLASNQSAVMKVSMMPTFNRPAYLEVVMYKEHQFWFDSATHSPKQYWAVRVVVAAPYLCATYNLRSVPTSWVLGHKKTFSVTIRNCGNVRWPVPHYASVDLNMHFTTVRGGTTRQAYWFNGASRRTTGYVLPGALTTVTITMTPTHYGHFYLEAGMLIEHFTWFDKLTHKPVQYASVAVTVKRS